MNYKKYNINFEFPNGFITINAESEEEARYIFENMTEEDLFSHCDRASINYIEEVVD